MLANKDAIATIPVKNLAKARQFYEGTLGLKPVDSEGDEVIVFKSGHSTLNVYRSSTPVPIRRPPRPGRWAMKSRESCAS
jgi:catechol 2,3-dioxygenase-like lactoylglutathione lyase family enzyme